LPQNYPQGQQWGLLLPQSETTSFPSPNTANFLTSGDRCWFFFIWVRAIEKLKSLSGNNLTSPAPIELTDRAPKAGADLTVWQRSPLG
jgi:hypothetical protein